MLIHPSILAQPENNAVDRQISMILVITNDKGCIQSVLLNAVSAVPVPGLKYRAAVPEPA